MQNLVWNMFGNLTDKAHDYSATRQQVEHFQPNKQTEIEKLFEIGFGAAFDESGNLLQTFQRFLAIPKGTKSIQFIDYEAIGSIKFVTLHNGLPIPLQQDAFVAAMATANTNKLVFKAPVQGDIALDIASSLIQEEGKSQPIGDGPKLIFYDSNDVPLNGTIIGVFPIPIGTKVLSISSDINPTHPKFPLIKGYKVTLAYSYTTSESPTGSFAINAASIIDITFATPLKSRAVFSHTIIWANPAAPPQNAVTSDETLIEQKVTATTATPSTGAGAVGKMIPVYLTKKREFIGSSK